MTTEITFPGKVPGMNGKGGLIRMHWTKKKKLKEAYTWLVRQATKNVHPGKVSIEMIRYSAGVTMDFDNLVSTGKVPLDAIVCAGVIQDDKDGVIVKRSYRQEKCKVLEQRTVITITDEY